MANYRSTTMMVDTTKGCDGASCIPGRMEYDESMRLDAVRFDGEILNLFHRTRATLFKHS